MYYTKKCVGCGATFETTTFIKTRCKKHCTRVSRDQTSEAWYIKRREEGAIKREARNQTREAWRIKRQEERQKAASDRTLYFTCGLSRERYATPDGQKCRHCRALARHRKNVEQWRGDPLFVSTLERYESNVRDLEAMTNDSEWPLWFKMGSKWGGSAS